jgi:hypothetical protein
MASVRPALADTLEQLPGAETAATNALNALSPSLRGLASLALDLRPGSNALPRTLGELSSTLVDAVRPLHELPEFAGRLGSTLTTVQDLSREPSTDGAIRKLTSVVEALRPTIQTLEPAQVYCNVVATMFSNFASVLGGYGLGPDGPPLVAFAITHVGAQGELLQQGKPSPNVDINYQPTENATECAGGNEPADGVTQHFNNPSGNVGHAHPNTAPPAASHALAKQAGLLTPPAGVQP